METLESPEPVASSSAVEVSVQVSSYVLSKLLEHLLDPTGAPYPASHRSPADFRKRPRGPSA